MVVHDEYPKRIEERVSAKADATRTTREGLSHDESYSSYQTLSTFNLRIDLSGLGTLLS